MTLQVVIAGTVALHWEHAAHELHSVFAPSALVDLGAQRICGVHLFRIPRAPNAAN
jgi:hypothetical protein